MGDERYFSKLFAYIYNKDVQAGFFLFLKHRPGVKPTYNGNVDIPISEYVRELKKTNRTETEQFVAYLFNNSLLFADGIAKEWPDDVYEKYRAFLDENHAKEPKEHLSKGALLGSLSLTSIKGITKKKEKHPVSSGPPAVHLSPGRAAATIWRVGRAQ